MQRVKESLWFVLGRSGLVSNLCHGVTARKGDLIPLKGGLCKQGWGCPAAAAPGTGVNPPCPADSVEFTLIYAIIGPFIRVSGACV